MYISLKFYWLSSLAFYLLLLTHCSMCTYAYEADFQQNTVLSNQRNINGGRSTPSIPCDAVSKKKLYVCFGKLSQMHELIGFPTSKEKLERRCPVFLTGMKCFHEYGSKCLSQENYIQMNDTVVRAETYYKLICNNQEFQKEFLHHKDCFDKITGPWDSCLKQFDSHFEHNGNRKTSDQNFVCCAKSKLLQCIRDSSSGYCSEVSVRFVQKTLLSLVGSDKVNFTSIDCSKFKQATCIAPIKVLSQFIFSAIFFVLLF